MADLSYVDLDDEDDEPDIIELSEIPAMDDALILRLTYDLATKLHKPEIIARRYGLGSTDKLKSYLLDHPVIVSQAKKLRAVFQSDASAEERVRMKFLHATEELIIPLAGLVADPKTPLSARIDGFKQIQRGAGLDGMSAANKSQQQRETGQAFNLTINFAGGRDMKIVGATIVEPDQIPGPTTGSVWDEPEDEVEIGEDEI